MADIIEELRNRAHESELLARAAAEIETLRRAATIVWQPMESAPKDEGPLLLYCPGLSGHVVDEIVTRQLLKSAAPPRAVCASLLVSPRRLPASAPSLPPFTSFPTNMTSLMSI